MSTTLTTADVKVSTVFILNVVDYAPPMRVRYFENVYGGKKGASESAVKNCALGDVVFCETRTSAAGKDFNIFGTCSRESYAGLVLKKMNVAELHPALSTKEVDVSTIQMQTAHGVVAVRQFRNVYKEKDDKRNVKQGAQSVAIQNAGDNIVFIRLHPTANGVGFRVWYTCPPSDFVKLLEQDNQLYEVIHRFPSKVYFDIEKYGIYPELFEESKAKIRELIPGAVLVESGGITYDERTEAEVAAGKPDKSKTSYHFVLDSHMITDERERKTVHDIALILKNESFGGDETVYGSNRGMKCVNQAKPGRPPQAAITHLDDLSRHIITACFNPDAVAIHVPSTQSEVKKYDITALPPRAAFSVDGLPCGEIDPTWQITDQTSPLELIQHIPYTPAWNYSQIHPTMRFAFHNGISAEDFVRIASAGHASMPEQLFRNWEKCANYPAAPRGLICQILQKYYPTMVYTDTTEFTTFAEQFDIPEPTKIKTLSQAQFSGGEKYVMLNLPMGCGKTTQCLEYIKDLQYIWVSPNIALANDLHGKTSATYYQDVNRGEKQIDGFVGTKQLLICMNSLHFVKETFDVVILDEIETILSKWDGDFMKGNKLPNWLQFVRLIKSAKRVILLDAFTTKRSIDLMQRIDAAPMSLFELEVVESTRTVNQVNSMEQMLNMIVTDLKADKKLFIYYPWKKAQRGVLSMSNLHEYIQNATGKLGVFYNSEVDDKVKTQLGSVKNNWSRKDFVITNNIVTCGVDYSSDQETTVRPFDVEYLFAAGFSNPRDIVQVSFRPRQLVTGIINLLHYGSPLRIEARHDDTQMMGEIYASLFKSTLIELNAPLKETLRMFFKKANYVQHVDPATLSAEIKREVRAAMGEFECHHSYLGLANISEHEFNRINSWIISRRATQTEKLCHQKYLFQAKFKTLGKWVEFGWDNQLMECADKIREMRYKPTSIFNRVSSENDLVGFPEEFDDLRLSPELRTAIFQKFKFKTLTAKSSAAAIIRNIYDAEFGTIYHSNKVTKTQTKTTLNPCMNQYFRFVFENIRPEYEKANMCRCTTSVLNDFCGHLLCGTCEKWADARDPEGPEERAAELASKRVLGRVEAKKTADELRALKDTNPEVWPCSCGGVNKELCRSSHGPTKAMDHPLCLDALKRIQRIFSSKGKCKNPNSNKCGPSSEFATASERHTPHDLLDYEKCSSVTPRPVLILLTSERNAIPYGEGSTTLRCIQQVKA